jgi:hypothetical protein
MADRGTMISPAVVSEKSNTRQTMSFSERRMSVSPSEPLLMSDTNASRVIYGE